MQQLGGNKFKAMTGAKNFSWDSETKSLTFQLPKAVNKIKMIRITLTPQDLYDMTFYSFNKSTYEIKKIVSEEGLYDDMLQSTFTEHTGLNTHL